MITIEIHTRINGVLMSKQALVVRPGAETSYHFGLPPLGPLTDGEITLSGYRITPNATFNDWHGAKQLSAEAQP